MNRTNPLTEMDDSGSRSALPHYSRGPWKLVRCEATGMVYLANPPDYSQLADEFEWEKSYLQEKAERAAREPTLALVSGVVKGLRRRFQRQQRIVRVCAGLLRELNTGAVLRVLDVGCASADKLQQIAGIAARENIAVQPVGIEISPALSKLAQARLEPLGGGCIQSAATEGLTGLEDRSADLIILCTFLEH
jgi:SAM-dependent methyltransferase